MLTSEEKVYFGILVILTLSWAAIDFARIAAVIVSRPGFSVRVVLSRAVRRLPSMLTQVGATLPVFRLRPREGVFHYLIFAAFSFYALVNVLDTFSAFTGFSTIGQNVLLDAYNLIADVLSVLGLIGMAYFLVRRFVQKPPVLNFNPGVVLYPKVSAGGIRRDSLIVGAFILTHVGSRWLGTAFHLAQAQETSLYLPTASVVSLALAGLPAAALAFGVHATFWLAVGLILLFFPYFVRSKHIHIFFAPLNWLLRPDRPLGEIQPLKTDGRPLALQDLRWHQLLDTYACIMCNRCQQVCPAHNAGQPLSPAALEINKRYYLTDHLHEFADGSAPRVPLLDYAISREAVWACTTCGACVDICPVGNAPMLDIIDIRRSLIEQGDTLDAGVQKSLENLGKQGNSFGASGRARAKWTQGLPFKVKDARKEPVDYLWFVGDYASFDARSQQLTRLVAKVLNDAGVSFGILYEAEWNSGNDARRVGEEGLFEMLAEHNVAALDSAQFKEIITTDPHTMNALRFEYAKMGKRYKVSHYSQVLARLVDEGKIVLRPQNGVNGATRRRVTYHDPCYLGRYNRVFDAPRALIERSGLQLVEMPRNHNGSFCCGAGGGQIWSANSKQAERPSEQRIREALALGDVQTFIVSCPKDMAMYSDAVKTSGNEGKVVVKDIIEVVVEAMAESAHEPKR
ncbi:MAG: (Fe-S)-binding protein [Chloroflexi bacterium]|nr:(Fe-S)-binding protein [Chloroflexota bacterium]